MLPVYSLHSLVHFPTFLFSFWLFTRFSPLWFCRRGRRRWLLHMYAQSFFGPFVFPVLLYALSPQSIITAAQLLSFRYSMLLLHFSMQWGLKMVYVCAWICVLMYIHNKKHTRILTALLFLLRCIKTTLGLTIVVSQLAWSHRQHFSLRSEALSSSFNGSCSPHAFPYIILSITTRTHTERLHKKNVYYVCTQEYLPIHI